jgi:hypothetical protein
MRLVNIQSLGLLKAHVALWETAKVIDSRLCVALMERSNVVDGDVGVEVCKASIRRMVGTG